VLEDPKGNESISFNVRALNVRDAPHASWVVKKKKPKPLISLKLSDAYPLMYSKRGPYAKERLRSPCAP
jgi:hypothetical protein